MKRKVLSGIFAAVLAASVLAGCGESGGETGGSSSASGDSGSASAASASGESAGKSGEDLKFVYISKQLTHPWFVQEEMGIKQACEELGIEYVGIDSDGNDEKCLSDIDSAFAMEADALADVHYQPEHGSQCSGAAARRRAYRWLPSTTTSWTRTEIRFLMWECPPRKSASWAVRSWPNLPMREAFLKREMW